MIIYAQDLDFYELCDNDETKVRTGEHIKSAMVLLLIYHLFEIVSLIYEIITVKRRDGGGLVKSVLKIN